MLEITAGHVIITAGHVIITAVHVIITIVYLNLYFIPNMNSLFQEF